MNAFKTIFFVFLILCFIQLLVFSGKIFYLGYKSYQLDCNIIEPNETNPGGYFNQADCTINIISYQDEKELDKIISQLLDIENSKAMKEIDRISLIKKVYKELKEF